MREENTLHRKDATWLARKLTEAVMEDVKCVEHYDPELDQVVKWMRVIVHEVRVHAGRRPVADVATEEMVHFMLFVAHKPVEGWWVKLEEIGAAQELERMGMMVETNKL